MRDPEGRRALLGTVTMIMCKLSLGAVPTGYGRTAPRLNLDIIVQRQGTVTMIMCKLSIGAVSKGSGRTAPRLNLHIIASKPTSRKMEPDR